MFRDLADMTQGFVSCSSDQRRINHCVGSGKIISGSDSDFELEFRILIRIRILFYRYLFLPLFSGSNYGSWSKSNFFSNLKKFIFKTVEVLSNGTAEGTVSQIFEVFKYLGTD